MRQKQTGIIRISTNHNQSKQGLSLFREDDHNL